VLWLNKAFSFDWSTHSTNSLLAASPACDFTLMYSLSFLKKHQVCHTYIGGCSDAPGGMQSLANTTPVPHCSC
jgi:hypothetical protein